jgi:hypothetical protein|tara:strand:+ start:1946 stop:2272 length:327 start_codon:yes stop_codon:yes gene_type:complete
MAQDFERERARNIGTSGSTIVTADSDDAIIGIRVANVVTQTIQVDVFITSGGNDYYLAKNVSIPQGSTIEFIDGGAKVNLETGDVVKVKSDTASSADCWLSYIDSIST